MLFLIIFPSILSNLSPAFTSFVIFWIYYMTAMHQPLALHWCNTAVIKRKLWQIFAQLDINFLRYRGHKSMGRDPTYVASFSFWIHWQLMWHLAIFCLSSIFCYVFLNCFFSKWLSKRDFPDLTLSCKMKTAMKSVINSVSDRLTDWHRALPGHWNHYQDKSL